MQFNMDKFIKKHWNGENSLVISYWVNSVVVSTICYYISAFIAGFFVGVFASAFHVPLPNKSTFGVIGMLAGIPILTWSVHGTWLSADNYNKEREGEFFTWGSLAKVGLTVGVMNYLAQLISFLMAN